MTDIKTYIPLLLDNHVLLCEFPTHIVEMHAPEIEQLKILIDHNMRNPIYDKVKLYEIRNKKNETMYSREIITKDLWIIS